MTDHPAKDCTEAQRRVFEQIATGNPSGHSTQVLSALAKKGLIDFIPHTVKGDRFGDIHIRVPFVPIHHHHQFCSWASEQPFDEEDL